LKKSRFFFVAAHFCTNSCAFITFTCHRSTNYVTIKNSVTRISALQCTHNIYQGCQIFLGTTIKAGKYTK
jgi:hypothetical protein